jgi:hypothetical protein
MVWERGRSRGLEAVDSAHKGGHHDHERHEQMEDSRTRSSHGSFLCFFGRVQPRPNPITLEISQKINLVNGFLQMR